jgi:hypothetical protein
MIRRIINNMLPFERVGAAIMLAVLVYVVTENWL